MQTTGSQSKVLQMELHCGCNWLLYQYEGQDTE